MFAVARADHIEKAIGEAMLASRWVVCDRFYDSTRAYQGATAGVPRGLINALERLTVGDLRPTSPSSSTFRPNRGSRARCAAERHHTGSLRESAADAA